MPGKRALREIAVGVSIAFGVWAGCGDDSFSDAQARAGAGSSKNDAVNTAGKISIDVHVTDKSGQLISGLKAADFKVFDNKHPQEILDFSAVDAAHAAGTPPEIQIILDAMNSGPAMVAQEREGVSAFLRDNAGKLEYATSIWVLENEGLKRIAPPSKDGAALLAALDAVTIPARAITSSAGGWGDVERANQAIEVIKQMIAPRMRESGHKLVLFISPGWPMLLNFEPDKRNWLFDEIVDISNGLRESNTTFYSLAPSDLSSLARSEGNSSYFAYDNYLKGVTKISDAQNASVCLQVLSEHSGGLVMTDGNDVKAEIKTAVRDAGGYYTLSFERASGHGRTEYHEIRVTVDKPRMKVRTTAGYYMKAP